jgi:large subunit ribosomal protein L13
MITHDIDASGQPLGRIASRIAGLLRGKDTAAFDPSKAPQVQVVVTNLDKVAFKGTKSTAVVHYRHSGYPGGLYQRTLGESWARNKAEVLRRAVRGMLPPNRSRDRLLKNLIVK